MSELIKALTIFLKYGDPTYPTHCEHDTMYVMIDPAVVSHEDAMLLKEIGFSPDENGTFRSYKFGSA
jgi:hypothetical protein